MPLPIQVARTNKNVAVRKQAMFWLGQSKDPRALAFFEEILHSVADEMGFPNSDTSLLIPSQLGRTYPGQPVSFREADLSGKGGAFAVS